MTVKGVFALATAVYGAMGAGVALAFAGEPWSYFAGVGANLLPGLFG